MSDPEAWTCPCWRQMPLSPGDPLAVEAPPLAQPLRTAAQRLSDAIANRSAAGRSHLDVASDIDMDFLDAVTGLRAALAVEAVRPASKDAVRAALDLRARTEIERIAKRLDGYCDNCQGDIRLDDGGRPCLDSIHAAANDVRGLAALAVEAAPPCEACARGDRSSHDQHRAVEAVRPETLRETVEEFLSENSAAEANGYIDLHPLRRALVEAQR